MTATIRNLSAVPSLVAAALRRALAFRVALGRLVTAVATVAALRGMQRAAVTAWRWHRVAVCSQSGKDSRRRRGDKQPNAPYNRHRAVA